MKDDSNFKLVNKSKHHTFLLSIIPGLVAFSSLIGLGPQPNEAANSSNPTLQLIYAIIFTAYYIYLGYKFIKIHKTIYKVFMVINFLTAFMFFLEILNANSNATNVSPIALNICLLVLFIIQIINIILIVKYKDFYNKQ